MMNSTRDVSSEYQRWAGGDGAMFTPSSPFGGDADAVRGGRIHEGRWQLHAATERELAQGGGSYEEALDRVLNQARAGTITLSATALEGTGITASKPGRHGRRHDPRSGHILLAGAPTADELGRPEAPSDQRDEQRFADTALSCLARRPGATLEQKTASSRALVERAAAEGASVKWTGA